MFRNSLKMLLGGKSNRKNRNSGGSSTEGDGLFEGDYGGPPLPVTEGMQHIRIMEGVSRSLPSSPLLSHQALNMRLQPTKRLPGEESQELGPPPSVDEAANTLMTRLGFLLGDKMNEGQSGSQYDMDDHDDSQVGYTHAHYTHTRVQ
nr:protein TANC2-like [Oncorhynchus nerka]XP_029492122.1 protein TANC2-like [Oncorhynchus nerka]